MIITINGEMGSGKSTVAKYLAEKLGFKHYSIGDFMGEIALEKGVTLLELSKIAEKNSDVDGILDEKQVYIGEHEDDFIIDSRLGWHFIPHSFKIYLKCNLEVAAKRIFGDKRADEKENTTLEKTKENMKRRVKSENRRYQEYYGLDQTDKEHYDYILNTADKNKQEVLDTVLDKVSSLKTKTFK